MQIEIITRALGDLTRLRIMRLLGTMELAVGELAQALGQSQPRVSRHVAILCDAGLAERRREGSWVFLRARLGGGEEAAPLGDAVARLLALAEREDEEFAALCAQDRDHLSAIRNAREAQAAQWFERHAEDWDELRALHSPDREVEARLQALLADAPLGRVLDIGTGTGRIAELLSARADHVVALDKSLDMLRVARAKLQHLPAARLELVQGDFLALPFGTQSFDTITLHQVLHFATEPGAVLREAARVTRPGGRIAIVDFAAHAHEELRERFEHRRLGFADAQIARALREAGFEPEPAATLDGGPLTVKIWIGIRAPGLSGKTRKAA